MRPPPAITIVESATAEGIREAAEGVETPGSYQAAQLRGAHSRFPGHALTPTGVMAIRCKQFHLPDL